MPAYNITIDSKFNPYSLQDRLLPIQMLQEQHNQAADAYATALANSAGLYDALRVNEEDALAAKYVNDYENSLQELADDLATNGLNRTNRRGVYETKAKTGYIEKLKKAIDNRNTFIAQQNELINRDPSLVISDYAANHGITRFLNPDFQYRSYSKNALRQQAAKLFEELSKSTYLDPNNPEYKRIAGLTMEMGIKAGLKSDDIQSAIDDIREHGMNGKSSKTTQILGNIAQGILISNLGEKENNPYWSEDQWNTAMREIMDESWHALGTEDFKTVNIDEPRASGSSGKSKDDWLLDPTFIQVLTAHKNKIEGFDNLQKEAIDNSISYLGGDDETTEMYKRGVGFSPVSTFTNIETLRNNIKKAIDSNDTYVKKRDSEGNPITYSKEGEEALKILEEYIREVDGIQLTDEKKAARLEQLRKKESEQLGRYRNGATGNATTAYMNTFNLGVPMLNDEERIEKEALEAENDALIKAGVSRFYHKFDYRDDDPTIEQIKRNLRYGEQLTDAQKDYIETRRQNYIKNHPEVKETENRRKKALNLIREAQDFFREGAILSDVIDLSRGIDDPNVIWRNIATDVRTEQAQDYLGKDRNGRFIDNRYKPITDYEQLYDKENGELKKGVHIAFDTDSDGKLGYVLFTDDPNGQRAFMEANPTSKSIDYSGMLSYANSMSNQQKINRELSSLRDSDEYIRAMYNAQRKGGINLTTEERNIINYEKQLLEMLKIAEQVSENAGREGFTNFYNQTTLSRKRYVEDPNKQIQVNNYGYNGYEGY